MQIFVRTRGLKEYRFKAVHNPQITRVYDLESQIDDPDHHPKL